MLRFFSLLLFTLAALTASAEETQRRINVASDEVEYGADGKNAVFRGNVLVSADGLQVWATTLHVQSDGKDHIYIASAAANAPVSLFCDDCATYVVRAEVGEQITFDAAASHLQLAGGVSLCADEGCRRGTLRADSADWQKNKQQLRLQGAPLVQGTWLTDDAAEPLQARAQNILYHFDSGEAILTGSASITRGDSNLTHNVIHFNIKTYALRAEGNADQRVQATFGGDG